MRLVHAECDRVEANAAQVLEANVERASKAIVEAGVKVINEERRTGKAYEKRIKAQHVFSIFVERRMPVVDCKYMSQERPITSTLTLTTT